MTLTPSYIASLNGPGVAPDRGGDPLDRKAPLKDQFDLDLSRANRSELLKLLEAAWPPSSHGNIRVMMYDGKIVSNCKDSPIKDFPVLPCITSIYVEGGRIEFWFRMDPRIRGCDITARIPVKTVDGKLMPYYGERDMKERARRFRNDAGISSWRRWGRLQATVDFMNELLSTEQRNSKYAIDRDLTSEGKEQSKAKRIRAYQLAQCKAKRDLAENGIGAEEVITKRAIDETAEYDPFPCLGTVSRTALRPRSSSLNSPNSQQHSLSRPPSVSTTFFASSLCEKESTKANGFLTFASLTCICEKN